MSPLPIRVISAKSAAFIRLLRDLMEIYRLRSGWSSGISSPSAGNCTMQHFLISMNLPYSEENTSGGGWPKFTKRKSPSGRISPYRRVAISLGLSPMPGLKTLRAVTDRASPRRPRRVWVGQGEPRGVPTERRLPVRRARRRVLDEQEPRARRVLRRGPGLPRRPRVPAGRLLHGGGLRPLAEVQPQVGRRGHHGVRRGVGQ